MLSFLRIRNIALISSLEAEFGAGLNVLTGETGSGKSIIVDSLGALTGDRITNDLIKEGETSAAIEGIFSLSPDAVVLGVLNDLGVEVPSGETAEVIVRRELTLTGKNRIFINDRLVTAGLLKQIGPLLVDIHGQGEQAVLFETASHRALLDEFAAAADLRSTVAAAFNVWSAALRELESLKQDEADKLQLVDVLKFQINEITRAAIAVGEADELEQEKRRLANVEKLSALSDEAYAQLYGMDNAAIGPLDQALKKIEELTEFDPRFRENAEGLRSARAIIEDAAITARDFRNHLEFSPDRLGEIEDRLAAISQVTRKYGGTAETAIAHLAESEERLANIESAELRISELSRKLERAKQDYLATAGKLHELRCAAASKFKKAVETDLRSVALDRARIEVRVDNGSGDEQRYTADGFDRVEFYFSANPGEAPKPLAKVASGGEASRLTLILKTAAHRHTLGKAAVFDEIDAGIGGRVAEAVGERLRDLAKLQQVLCVTHQAQVASKADHHLLVEKTAGKRSTAVSIRAIEGAERIEEIARMLAGETITEAARENARVMLAFAG